MNKKKFFNINEQELAKIAEEFAIKQEYNIFALMGDLGTGKTFWTRNYINSLSEKNLPVSSPSFTLLKQYQINELNINHFDLYRLDSEQEIWDLGIIDYFNMKNNITIIEWADKFLDIFPENSIKIFFYHNNSNTRDIVIEYPNSL